jgi:hypothetical protein
MPAKRVRVSKHCSTYSKTRHNFYTYKVEIKNIEDSDKSK